MIALTTKLVLPVQIDHRTLWVDTRLTQNSFIYVYNIDVNNVEFYTLENNLEQLKKEKLQQLHDDINHLRNVVKYCISTKRNFVIKYVCNDLDKAIEISFTPKELDNARLII